MKTDIPVEPPLTAADVRRLWRRLKAAEEFLVAIDKRLAAVEERSSHFAPTWVNPTIAATTNVPYMTYSVGHHI